LTVFTSSDLLQNDFFSYTKKYNYNTVYAESDLFECIFHNIFEQYENTYNNIPIDVFQRIEKYYKENIFVNIKGYISLFENNKASHKILLDTGNFHFTMPSYLQFAAGEIFEVFNEIEYYILPVQVGLHY